MQSKNICILGGSGFVGRAIVYRLARQGGHRIRVLTRSRNRHRDMLVTPGLELIESSTLDQETLENFFTGSDAVINLVGILNEPGHDGKGFHRVHAELPKTIITACLQTGIKRLLHMSALNADASRGPSFYLRSKGEGENHVHTFAGEKVNVTSFRPSVIFGPGDSFLNRFARLLKLLPVFPLACPDTRFAPVYVGDVADRFIRAIDDKSTYGQRYDLCGPEEYTLKELVEYTALLLKLKRVIISQPDFISKIQAHVLEWFPGKPFSIDNYNSLQLDSVCTDAEHEPTTLEMIAPTYLGRANRHHNYDSYRKSVRRS